MHECLNVLKKPKLVSINSDVEHIRLSAISKYLSRKNGSMRSQKSKEYLMNKLGGKIS